MSELLSQAEIDALLSGGSALNTETAASSGEIELNPQEIDALGEIGNISMGTASTTLFTLLGQKVLITTPNVIVTTLDEMTSNKSGSYVAVKAEFTHGLKGTNLLILKEEDVKITTDLMMGGDGSNTTGPITDLHLSAISEAMNQMIGSAATSMSAMLNKKIEISPPKAFCTDLDKSDFKDFNDSEKLVKISFKMEIGELINSEMQQLLPVGFAKEMVAGLIDAETKDEVEETSPDNSYASDTHKNYSEPIQNPIQENVQQAAAVQYAPPQMNQQPYQQAPAHNQIHMTLNNQQTPVNIQPAQFQAFDDMRNIPQKENIGLLMDIPLQVTVELGRTNKYIREVLEFAPGSIIELDKLAGEHVDILVNGKIIAKGEVVIIDESFGVRVTDIVQPSKRL